MAKKGSDIKHLLLVRLSAMGDVAMVVYAVRALRASYPDLRISILTREQFYPLFENLGLEFIAIDLKGDHNGVAGINRLAQHIVDQEVDCVADLHDVLRTKLLRLFLSMRGVRSAKIHKGRIKKWMRMEGGCREVTQPLKHTVLRYCDVLRHLGLEINDPTPATKETRANPTRFDRGEGRWIGVAPFSAHEGKCYPKPLMAIVIEELSKRYERVFIHSGGGAEVSFAHEMGSTFPNVVAVFGTMSLSEEVDLIANLDCVVSMDSFVMHVASLTATPVVSVWGATHPSLGFSGYGSSKKGYVQLELECRPCSTFGNKPCRFGDYHCLSDINPMEIVERVEHFVKSRE